MSIWKRWFAKHSDPASPEATSVTCPFCEQKAAHRVPAQEAYPVWDCECSAIGSGSLIYADLDEVADSLLAILGIAGSVSEPDVPAGSSGMISMQHYDIPRSLRQLEEILQSHDFELRKGTWLESGHQVHSIWVRRISS